MSRVSSYKQMTPRSVTPDNLLMGSSYAGTHLPSNYANDLANKSQNSGVVLRQTQNPRVHQRRASNENQSMVMMGMGHYGNTNGPLMTSSGLLGGPNGDKYNRLTQASTSFIEKQGATGRVSNGAGLTPRRNLGEIPLSQNVLKKDENRKVPKLSLLNMGGYSETGQKSSQRNKENQYKAMTPSYQQTKGAVKGKTSSPLQSDRNSNQESKWNGLPEERRTGSKGQSIEEEYLKALAKLEQKKEKLLAKQKEDHDKVARLFTAIAKKKGLIDPQGNSQCIGIVKGDQETRGSERDSEATGTGLNEAEEYMKKELLALVSYFQSISNEVFLPSHIRSLVDVWGSNKEEQN